MVRQAVKDGTLGELLAKHRSTPMPKRPRRPANPNARPRKVQVTGQPAGAAAAAVPGAAPAPAPAPDQISPGETIIWCALCSQPKPESQIAITVGDEPFCNTCDHVRRKANNLGMSTREVTHSHKQGSLAAFLGLTSAQLDAQLGRAGAAGAAAGPSAPGSSSKAGTLGRLCRSCKQVRAPIVGAQALILASIRMAVSCLFSCCTLAGCISRIDACGML